MPAREIDTQALAAELHAGGAVVATGTSKAVLGDPLLAVVSLGRQLAKSDRTLAAGTVIATGGMAAFAAVETGFYSGIVASIGEVHLAVT